MISKLYPFLIILFYFTSLHGQNDILSPTEYLPTNYGEKFTPHHLHDAYVRYLAANSPYIHHEQYGWTEEKRPLNFLVVSDPSNLSQRESLRINNLKRAGLTEGEPNTSEISIVWLGFGVHGNEAGGSESALQVLYQLANPNPDVQSWLKDVIVLIDASVNPDGYNRYTQWNREVTGLHSDINPVAYEHQEPWPGGRLNHYQFDLNRDWLWCTQVESQQRIKKYGEWMPHISVDIHEMFYNSTYYFAPAAEPYHEHITDWQRSFQETIGNNNAKHFDKHGWGYFTQEVFDLLYPSYGDTYPTFNGSIGMTYEQAGHARAGQAIQTKNGDTLMIRDRIDHHTVAALSTIEAAAKNSGQLVREFEMYFDSKPNTSYQTYIIRRKADLSLSQVTDFLDLHGIKYFQAKDNKQYSKAYNFSSFAEGKASILKGDLVIPINQPKSRLVDVLCNPTPTVSDSLTYDITAWSYLHSLPYQSFALRETISHENFTASLTKKLPLVSNPSSYVVALENIEGFKTVIAILRQGYKARYNSSVAIVDGMKFDPGTIFFNRYDNSDSKDFISYFSSLGSKVIPLASGRMSSKDLGSDNFQLIHLPKIALLTGEGTVPNANGHYWHFMEKRLDIPCTRILVKDVSSSHLKGFDIVIMPHGGYSSLDSMALAAIFEFVNMGGKVIAEEGALSILISKDILELKSKSDEDDQLDEEDEKKTPPTPRKYGQAERDQLTKHNPGIVIRAAVDDSHPLSTGLGSSTALLKLNAQSYELLEKGWNVAFLDDNLTYSGFLGSKLHESLTNSLLVGQENFGQGQFVYFVDRPLFRGFWQNSQILFCNALLKNVL